ncbi:ribonuclease H-like domain-containing protein [Tanacetum coccineum]
MESQSETTQTVSTLKLPEQYLTHIDYALWEVIVNGDAPAIASASAGTEGPIHPKTTEQKLARKNELKAKSTLLLVIPNEQLLKCHGIKDAKTLWEAIKVYEYEIKGQSSSSLNSQNVVFVFLENISSTNEAVNTAHEVSTTSSQGQTSSLTYADDIDIDDLKEMDLKWQVAMLTMRVECYNCHMRGHFARECMAPRNQENRNRDYTRRVVPVETLANALVVQDGIGGYDWSFQAEEGITNFALIAYTSQGYQIGLESLEARIVVHEKNEAVYEEDIAFLNAKDKAGLGYDSQMNESEVVYGVFNSRESDVDDSPVNDRFKIGEGFHAVSPPYTGNYMPSRPDLSFLGLDDSVYKTKVSETETISKTSKDIVEKTKTVRPSDPIIED